MGLIKLSAEFRQRIDRASGHSNTIPELCAPHTNPAFDQISEFIVSMKHDAVRLYEGVVPLSVLPTWRLPAFYKPSSNHETVILHWRYFILILFNIVNKKSSGPKQINMSAIHITVLTDRPQPWSSARISWAEVHIILLWRKCCYSSFLFAQNKG